MVNSVSRSWHEGRKERSALVSHLASRGFSLPLPLPSAGVKPLLPSIHLCVFLLVLPCPSQDKTHFVGISLSMR